MKIPSMQAPVDVIFIAGSGRSGSTLLDRVLGTLPNTTSHNELRAVPKRGLGDNQLCACGEQFRQCEFWAQVISAAGIVDESVSAMIQYQMEIDRLRTFPRLYFGVSGSNSKESIKKYQALLVRLYRAIATVSGKPVIIDSTKIPTHALLLSGAPGIRLHVLHLVRDARDIASAWKKRKYDKGTGSPMRYMSPLFATFSWVIENLFSEMLKRLVPYYRIRYEDFIVDPQAVLGDICAYFEPLHGRNVELANGNIANLGVIHAISGNPDRFIVGPTFIGKRAESGEGPGLFSHIMATAIGFPLLVRYGYISFSSKVRPKKHKRVVSD